MRPTHALVDGNDPPPLGCKVTNIVGGDAKEACISAASILAKTARDAHMVELCARYPGYGFSRHKGYGSPAHLEALRQLGPSPVHRRSFAPVREALGIAD
jgi:ribonuclease HII